jgi:hypothetical protein
MKRRCRREGCGAYLRHLNPGPLCGPCNRAAVEEARLKSQAEYLAALEAEARTEKPRGNLSGICLCGCGGRTEIAKKTRTDLGHLRGAPVFYVRGHYPPRRQVAA